MIWNHNFFDRRVLLLLIAFEAVLFGNFFFREIAWYPPQNFDQTAFLTEAYRLETRVLSKGIGELWKALWTKGNPSGLLLPIEGAFSGLVLGGARWPQLCVLFIAFSTLQVVVFNTARTVWSRRAYGYLALGLLLCQTTAWFWAGGLFDFRLDFAAYCLYGIWVCLVIRSELFLNRPWAIMSGLIGAVLVLHRFLSIIYLFGICAGFVVTLIVIGFLARRNATLTPRLKQRLYNVGLSLGILVALVSPILFANRSAIHDYYIVGHITGQERYVRAAEFGIKDLAGHLLYYPQSIFKDHLGITFLWASALAIVVGLVVRVFGRSEDVDGPTASRDNVTLLFQIIFLLGSIFGPIVVLTIDISKSPVVGGIVGVPATLLIVALIAATPNPRALKSLLCQRLVVGCSLLIFVLGIFTQFDQASRHLPVYAERQGLKEAAKLDKWLVQYALEQHWTSPSISLDVISGLLHAGAITASGFEQTGELVDFRTMLGGSMILGVDRQEALSRLAESDFVILTTLQKSGVYPFYQRIAEYWNDLKSWADKNMILARTVPLHNFTATVYVRPTAKIIGASGNWITSDGLVIEASREVLQRFPVIRLSGHANYSWLPKAPVVSATTIDLPDTTKAIPASLRRTDDGYEILIDVSQLDLSSGDSVRLKVNFDSFFVPKTVGISEDTRKLVVMAPDVIRLMPRGS